MFNDVIKTEKFNLCRDIAIGLVSAPLIALLDCGIRSRIAKIFKINFQPQSVANTIRNSVGSFSASAIVFGNVAIIAPIAEEFIFRYFIQRKLLPIVINTEFKKDPYSHVGTVARLGITTLIFSLGHFEYQLGRYNLAMLPAIAARSLTWGVMSEYTDSILAPIVSHAVMNTMAFCLARRLPR